jgi:hypothetical protein
MDVDAERWLRVMRSVIYGHEVTLKRCEDHNMLAIMINMEIKFRNENHLHSINNPLNE